jgi:hypothetical protein
VGESILQRERQRSRPSTWRHHSTSRLICSPTATKSL